MPPSHPPKVVVVIIIVVVVIVVVVIIVLLLLLLCVGLLFPHLALYLPLTVIQTSAVASNLRLVGNIILA